MFVRMACKPGVDERYLESCQTPIYARVPSDAVERMSAMRTTIRRLVWAVVCWLICAVPAALLVFPGPLRRDVCSFLNVRARSVHSRERTDRPQITLESDSPRIVANASVLLNATSPRPVSGVSICLQSNGTCLVQLRDGESWRGPLTSLSQLSPLWDLQGHITASQWLLVAAFAGLCLLLLSQAAAWLRRPCWFLPAGVTVCTLGVAVASLTLAVVVRSSATGRLATKRAALGSDFYASIFFIILCIAWGVWALWEWLQERRERRTAETCLRTKGPTHYHRQGERCHHL